MTRATPLVLALMSMVCSEGSGRREAGSVDSTPPEATAEFRPGAITLAAEEVARGLDAPVYLTAPAGDVRNFVVEQPGRIRIIENGVLLAKPFLDITSKVGYGGERGLLSVAFSPQYRSNGFLFVNYTDKNGDTKIERYKASTDRNVADPASAKLILAIDQPYANHNGGLNLFGPDGMLYIGMGDGGSQGDPHGNGQNPNALLGKLLRINVDRAEPYVVPDGNPYAKGGGRGEVWALGLRNPWRFSFDRVSGRLYIADVGQDKYEEINVVPETSGGVNYGWNVMEGPSCYRRPLCSKTGLQLPAFSYTHDGGTCSIIGGYVYRGRKIPEIVGQYFYSDYCTSWVRSLTYKPDGTIGESHQWIDRGLGNIVSFGEDAQGELYICSSNGRVYRIVKSAGTPTA
ncbi:MAG TPA: PQQ-dependent sugar dehydrogenase [Gemmatimonadaceae bacterium]|nr:PQQ-dependent sugar dehydrogenase [Gemmatimonadaceae bacterium]